MAAGSSGRLLPVPAVLQYLTCENHMKTASVPCVESPELTARALAFAFARELGAHLGLEKLRAIDLANKTAEAGVCCSHDYCDANEVMARAFWVVVGRRVKTQDDGDCSLWSRAWDLAKRQGLVWLSESGGSPLNAGEVEGGVLVLWTNHQRALTGRGVICKTHKEIGAAVMDRPSKRAHFVSLCALTRWPSPASA